MKQVLFASTNPGKVNEAKAFFEKENIEMLSLRDFSWVEPVEETGETFEENAMLKAQVYFHELQIPCIADDGGLMVDALGGAPGVHSHRFLGIENPTTEELALGILEKMRGIPKEKRTARLGGVTVFWDGGHLAKAESWVEGYITEEVMDTIQEGFPYRPIFMIPALGKVYSKATPEERNSFRIKNLEQLKKDILQYL
ncbi:MAG: non-canonical purine NTP pyrophosphatase [bacterium]|nr:non-canonical purine NTP pyrophosphatase [bacterium]